MKLVKQDKKRRKKQKKKTPRRTLKEVMQGFKTKPDHEEIRCLEFLDTIGPSIIKFYPNYFVIDDSYRCVWTLSEFPKSTEQLALLSALGEKEDVTVRIYTRQVSEEDKRRILTNAFNKNRLKSNETNVNDKIEAEMDITDQVSLMSNIARNNEPLLHTAVYLEMIGKDKAALESKQLEVEGELNNYGISFRRLNLRQREGFRCIAPGGFNALGDQYERILPASSVANLFPFCYSGKTDAKGFYLGKDKYGSNILVDFQKRSEDKTNANIVILGNSGQGKSYLLKLILTNLRESGMSIICLDPEEEYQELSNNLQGCYIDLLEGKYFINVLEPKLWNDTEEEDENAPKAFRTTARISQHISFLIDFFSSYRPFQYMELALLEIMLRKFYSSLGLDDDSDLSDLTSKDYPILSDFYQMLEDERKSYLIKGQEIYSKETLERLMLGLNSICVGNDSKFFNNHTNITSDMFVTFGVKGLLGGSSENLRNAILFNILSYMSNELLTRGNAVGSLDEFYLFLSNKTAVEYIRNFMKRVRKKDSMIIIASQNLEDFSQPGIRELTKPLLAIPSHQFLFNPGNIDGRFYSDNLQVEDSEYALIKNARQGNCLYRCGMERYNLMVHAPSYKEALFGRMGGR